MINTEEPTKDERQMQRDLVTAYHNSYSMLSFEEYVQQQKEGTYDKASLPKYTEDENVFEAVPTKGSSRTKLPNQNSM